MDTRKILADLYAEREHIDAAISALEALRLATNSPQPAKPAVKTSPKPTVKKRTLSAEGRKRIAEAAKKRWAKQKKAAAANPAAKSAKKASKKATKQSNLTTMPTA